MCLQIELLLFLLTAASELNMIQATSCSSNIINLEATETAQIITSPDYPEEYDSNLLCRWVISAKNSDEVVHIKIVDSQLPHSLDCDHVDHLQIQDGEGLYSFSLRMCCGSGSSSCQGDSVTSSKQKMRVTFKTDAAISDKGFQLKFWAVNKVSKIYKKPEWGAVNYFLFTLFGVIVTSITMGLIIVGITGYSNGPERPKFKCNSTTLKPISGLILSVALVLIGLPIFIGVIYIGKS